MRQAAILIPNAVIEEIHAGQDTDQSAPAVLAWANQCRVDNVRVVASIQRWDLGFGESQVIAHRLGASRWAVLDDRAAGRCAVAHNVPVIQRSASSCFRRRIGRSRELGRW